MLLIMGVSLYTSRIVLDTLGIEDYGIYNIVGGVVTMFAFLNGAMVAASQRFISFELGKGDLVRLKKVFCTSVSIHICIALIILIIAETVGLWFLNTKLNINPDRMVAANWAYQFSIFTFLIGVISVPYNSCIVAHEHMKAFAYISIIEVILKLITVYLLFVWDSDKLKLYSALTLMVAVLVRILYGIYCRRHFAECKYQYSFDKDLFKQMFSFAGWSLIGNLGFSFKDQGSNILLNIFFGTAVNAARGIAMQVNGAISGFSSNFQMAINPQITKSYAAGNYEYTQSLISKGCRYSFYLLAIISIPVFVNIDYILGLWLTVVPEYTPVFLRLVLITALVNSMANPFVTVMQATGKIRNFQIIICIIMLLDLPISYIVLKMGYLPYAVMYVSLFTTTIGLFARLFLMKQLISYSARYFIFNIFLKNIILMGIAILILYYIQSLFVINFLLFAIMFTFNVFFVGGVFYLGGMDIKERRMVRRKILSEIKNKLH
jgi:O-antigen/teichoic acid export membrane protein